MVDETPKGWTKLDPDLLAERGLTVDEAADAYELKWPGTVLSHERKAERMLNQILKGRISPDEVKAAAQEYRKQSKLPNPEWKRLS